MKKDSICKIREYHECYPQLCHASNILKKYEDGQKIDKLIQIADKYIIYLEENLKLAGYLDTTIQKRVSLLNDYYNFIHNNNLDNLYSSQGKFRPTILEEFVLVVQGFCCGISGYAPCC